MESAPLLTDSEPARVLTPLIEEKEKGAAVVLFTAEVPAEESLDSGLVKENVEGNVKPAEPLEDEAALGVAACGANEKVLGGILNAVEDVPALNAEGFDEKLKLEGGCKLKAPGARVNGPPAG